MKPNRTLAFTLIELLVVIAVMRDHTAITSPSSLSQAKAAAATQTASLSRNQKQIGLARDHVCGRHDDTLGGIGGGSKQVGDYSTFPGYDNGYDNPVWAQYNYMNWQEQINPYMKNDGKGQARSCPVAVDTDGSDGWGCVNPHTAGFGNVPYSASMACSSYYHARRGSRIQVDHADAGSGGDGHVPRVRKSSVDRRDRAMELWGSRLLSSGKRMGDV